jgi:hypothetical protein
MLHLKLLIIMTKAYLKSNPLGAFRKKAIIRTARLVFSEARSQANALQSTANVKAPTSQRPNRPVHPDHIFLQRAQMLAVMANAFANGKSIGQHRKRAMSENIDQICGHLSMGPTLFAANILKVA